MRDAVLLLDYIYCVWVTQLTARTVSSSMSTSNRVYRGRRSTETSLYWRLLSPSLSIRSGPDSNSSYLWQQYHSVSSQWRVPRNVSGLVSNKLLSVCVYTSKTRECIRCSNIVQSCDSNDETVKKSYFAVSVWSNSVNHHRDGRTSQFWYTLYRTDCKW